MTEHLGICRPNPAKPVSKLSAIQNKKVSPSCRIPLGVTDP
jgi:hypothetical protein